MDSPPDGYAEPLLTSMVEHVYDDEAGHVGQLGAFTSEDEARKLLDRLTLEGRWSNLRINMVAVHERVVDWEWDR